MIDLDGILLVGAVVLIVAIIAARVGARVGSARRCCCSSGSAWCIGESGFGIPFEDAELAQALGFGALVVILAEGGLTTKWKDIRASVGLAAVLATVGVGVSVGLMTLFGYFVLGLDIWMAVLLGAVTSPTDAAAVFSVLRHVPIPHRLRGALEAESGLNDAPPCCWSVLASASPAGTARTGGPLLLVGLIVARAGRRPGDRARARLGRVSSSCAGWPCPPRASTRWPRWSGRSSRTGPRPRCTPAASPPSTSAR